MGTEIILFSKCNTVLVLAFLKKIKLENGKKVVAILGKQKINKIKKAFDME